MDVSDELQLAGDEIRLASSESLAEKLNSALGKFVGTRFKSESGCVVDRDNRRSDVFASVVHAMQQTQALSGEFASDGVAAVVDASDELDLERFRVAYRRIAQAKQLSKTPTPSGEVRTNVTLGIIFALRSHLPLEVIAEELDRLNRKTPGREWPNMVVLANVGTLNYAVQFPGGSLSGDFLPPAEGALDNYIPAIYVVAVMQPAGGRAFDKMVAFLAAHLGIFSPGADLPNWSALNRNIPRDAVTLFGYQYNLHGQLMPVPREFYNDRYIPSRPLRIEDQGGSLLATIRYVPWQDGGTVLLEGRLPLEGILVFLGQKFTKRGGVIRMDDRQISHVLPITAADFSDLLVRFQRQSNMLVRHDPGKFLIQKIADEGTRSPFMARIFLGVMRVRDAAIPDKAKRDEFDALYDSVLSALSNSRESAQKVIEIWKERVAKISTGEIVRRRGSDAYIEESIDREIRKEIESFLNASTRALKTSMQALAKSLGLEIGFLFKQQNAFEKGVQFLEGSDPALGKYLRHARTWTEPLIKLRIDLEHSNWSLPRISYTVERNTVKANEPAILDKSVSEFVAFSLDRLTCFVEEITAHCLKMQMPEGTTITEIPLAGRVSECSERFMVTIAVGGMPPWRIAYHGATFEET